HSINIRKEQYKGLLYFTYDEAQNDCLPRVGHWNMMNKYFVKINITKYLFTVVITRVGDLCVFIFLHFFGPGLSNAPFSTLIVLLKKLDEIDSYAYILYSLYYWTAATNYHFVNPRYTNLASWSWIVVLLLKLFRWQQISYDVIFNGHDISRVQNKGA
ncbi:hypothetical protein ACJX0J_006709, partial [Zea mays]